MPQVSRSVSAYAPATVGIGIVHLGLGAFHRAHQAYYVERWLSQNGGGDWGICAASIRSNRSLIDALNAQHGRYHVVAWTDRQQVRITEIHAIREALFAGDDRSALLARMTQPATRIVSLTVTEKGYHLHPASGELDLEAADIRHDLAHPAAPRTAPGLLLEALRLRRQRALPPFTVLCCDNMPANGERTRRAVTTLARQQSPALADWIDASVPFPSAMVDRIVPAVTVAMRAGMAELIGASDAAAVTCESFTQWVIEDRFAAGRPDWESVGVEMVADVTPWETLKLRLLNGAHSLMAYVGLQRGFTTVSAAIADPAIDTLVRDYFAEAAQSLTPTAGIDPAAYAARLRERFANDALQHRLSQIALDGSQKLPQRWLQGAAVNLAQNRPIGATAIGLAAWLAYVRGRNDRGDHWQVDDPLAARLAACHREGPALEAQVASLLAIDAVFPRELADNATFRTAVIEACRADAR